MRILVPFFTLILFNTPLFSQTPQVLRIDPSFATGKPAAQVFDEVNYIPLETTKQSLFGTVNQLEISDSLFIILDKSTNSILFFDKKGNFKTKISGRSRDILSFQLEKDKNRIRLLQSNTKNLDQIILEKAETDLSAATKLLNKLIRVSYYDLQGKLIPVAKKESHLTPSNYSSLNLPNGFSISNFALAAKRMADTQAYELNYFKNNQQYKAAFPYNPQNDIAKYGRYLNSRAGFTRSPNDTVLYFTRPLNYSIYKLRPHTVEEKYQLIFPAKYTFPESFYADDLSQNDRLTFFRDNPAMITALSNVHVRKDLLFFKINNNERNWNASNSLMYNGKTGDLISLNRVSGDSSTYFLPLFDYSFGNESFKNSEGEYLYTYISSRRMFQAFEAGKKRNVHYPERLQQYFANGKPKDNPLIVQLKPKLN